MSARQSDSRGGERMLVDAMRAGDQDAFGMLAERYRRELEVHCYRMLGSLEDAEDTVQEALLRAWRKRDLFEGRSTYRAWLYGITTNACLDVLERRSRRVLPSALALPADPLEPPPPPIEAPWLDPYPDRLLDEIVDDEPQPHERVAARETMELVFLAAIQYLPPRQRAVLLLRDVLGWSARESSAMLDMTVIAGNSALQRARASLKEHLPERRLDWPRNPAAEADELRLLAQYMDAWKRTDVGAMVALLKEDARLVMPPIPSWYAGRQAVLDFLSRWPMSPTFPVHIHVPTRANRQPAFAVFARGRETGVTEPLGVEVLRIEDGLIAEITIFLKAELVPAFVSTPPP